MLTEEIRLHFPASYAHSHQQEHQKKKNTRRLVKTFLTHNFSSLYAPLVFQLSLVHAHKNKDQKNTISNQSKH